jgi:hypothetical protein
MELAENRDTEYLDQLAHQLKIDKTPACRRAINRILAEMKTITEDLCVDRLTSDDRALRHMQARSWSQTLSTSP